MELPRPLCLGCFEAQEAALRERYRKLISQTNEAAILSMTTAIVAEAKGNMNGPWTKEMQEIVDVGAKALAETVRALENEREEALDKMRVEGGYDTPSMVEG